MEKSKKGIKCPVCSKTTEVISERKPGWGCEEKKVYVCPSCGWQSKPSSKR